MGIFLQKYVQTLLPIVIPHDEFTNIPHVLVFNYLHRKYFSIGAL